MMVPFCDCFKDAHKNQGVVGMQRDVHTFYMEYYVTA